MKIDENNEKMLTNYLEQGSILYLTILQNKTKHNKILVANHGLITFLGKTDINPQAHTILYVQ